MEKNISPAKSGIIYGVLFGVIMVLEFTVMYVIGMKSLVDTLFGTIVNIANYLILPILFIFIGCTNYKTKLNNGFVTFIECLKIGVSITFIAAAIYATFSVLFNFIFPEFMDEMVAITRETMLKSNPNLTSEQMESGLAMMKKFSNPFIVFPATLAMYSFMGLFYSLIIGMIVKNEKPQSF
jgi:hypothetical protein